MNHKNGLATKAIKFKSKFTVQRKAPVHRRQGAIMKNRPLFVRVEWDEDAHVWVATSDDVPGLATEECSIELLIDKLKVMIPELLELNRGSGQEQYIEFEMLSRRFETLQPASA